MTKLAVPVTKNQEFAIKDGRQSINNKRSREVRRVGREEEAIRSMTYRERRERAIEREE